MADFGVINEIGDMGLGFRPLTEEDNKTVNEAVNGDNNSQVINEDNKKDK